MKLSDFIPFAFLPGSWGLSGKTRKIAAAEYYHTGWYLEKALAEINNEGNPDKLDLDMVGINLKYKQIEPYDAEIKTAELNHKISKSTDDNVLALAKLDIDLKYEKTYQQEYDRKSADLLGKPFMAMPKISWDPADPKKTYFELDYNEYFVTYLEQHGYAGNEETIINQWLNDICSSILDEMVSNEPEFVRTVRSVRRDDGKTEHS
jgi:hypothetical protein